MTALTDLSDVVNRSTGGNSGTPEAVNFFKSARVGGIAGVCVAGRISDLWRYAGHNGPGAAPGAVAIPTNATAGALKQANGGGSRQKWRLSITAALIAGARGTLVLYDRLLHISGLDGTSIAAQNVGGTLTRYTSGEGNQILVTVNTQIGATARTITASYSNTTPTSGRTTEAVAIGGTGLREVERGILLPLQSGDTGVSAVASVTLSASTGTAGNFGVSIIHPIAYIPLAANGDGKTVGIIEEIPDDACLAWYFLASSTAPPEFVGQMFSIES